MDDAQLHQQFTAIMTQLGSLSSLPAKVDGVREKQEELCEKQDELAKEFHTQQLSDAKTNTSQDLKIEALEGQAKGAFKKIGDHVDGHWKFYLATSALVGIIMTAGSFLHG